MNLHLSINQIPQDSACLAHELFLICCDTAMLGRKDLFRAHSFTGQIHHRERAWHTAHPVAVGMCCSSCSHHGRPPTLWQWGWVVMTVHTMARSPPCGSKDGLCGCSRGTQPTLWQWDWLQWSFTPGPIAHPVAVELAAVPIHVTAHQKEEQMGLEQGQRQLSKVHPQ